MSPEPEPQQITWLPHSPGTKLSALLAATNIKEALSESLSLAYAT